MTQPPRPHRPGIPLNAAPPSPPPGWPQRHPTAPWPTQPAGRQQLRHAPTWQQGRWVQGHAGPLRPYPGPGYQSPGYLQSYPVVTRQRRGAGCAVAAVVLVGVGLVILLLGAAALSSLADELDAAAPVTEQPVPPTITAPPPASATSSPPPTPTPTATPTADSPYKNDDYVAPPPDFNAPPVPQPTSGSDAQRLTLSNPVYSQVVPVPTRCEVDDIDASTASDAVLEEHFNAMIGCFMRAWSPPVTAAGFTLPRPPVTIYHGTITTKCGELSGYAFYCSNDQRIYYPAEYVNDFPDDLRRGRVVTTRLIAHEFGHAIQGRTGIFYSAYVVRSQLPESQAVVENARLELQADCFAAQSILSAAESMGWTQQDFDELGRVIASTGEPGGIHGSSQSQLYWIQQGLSSPEVSACNTFTAGVEVLR